MVAVPCFNGIKGGTLVWRLSILAYKLYLSHCNVFAVFHQMNGIHSPSDRQLDCLLSKFLLSQTKLL